MSEEGYSTYEIRIRAVQAVERGWTVSDAADAFGVARRTLHRWLSRYENNGESGLERSPGSGRPRKLEAMDEDELQAIVLQPASTFGYETDLWTVGRLHRIIRERYHVAVSRDTVWRRLREAGLTYQKPEREYCEIDEEARKEWQRDEVPKIRKCVEKYRAILYFQDESNVSLTAFLGKTWAPRGRTPKARVTGKRGGVAAMSAISKPGHLAAASRCDYWFNIDCHKCIHGICTSSQQLAMCLLSDVCRRTKDSANGSSTSSIGGGA